MKSNRVIVQAALNDQTINHGINRNLKDITVVTCVEASGEYLIQYVVTSQDSSAFQFELQKLGIEFHGHLEIVPSQKPSVNGKTFVSHIRTVILPYVAKIRREIEIEDEEAAVLMDNCQCHVTSEVMTLLTQPKVRVITFALPITNIFQMLDFTLFKVFKRVGKYNLPFDNLNSTSHFISNLLINFLKERTPPNIWTALSAIALEFDVRRIQYRVIFHSEKL
jgi:hypothetical protein